MRSSYYGLLIRSLHLPRERDRLVAGLIGASDYFLCVVSYPAALRAVFADDRAGTGDPLTERHQRALMGRSAPLELKTRELSPPLLHSSRYQSQSV